MLLIQSSSSGYDGLLCCLAMTANMAGYAGWLSCLLCWLSLMALMAGYAGGHGENL
jgi:hypothetical protein